MTIKKWLERNLPLIEARVNVKVAAQDLEGRSFYRKDRKAKNLDPQNCCFIGAAIKPYQYSPSLEHRSVLDLDSVFLFFSAGTGGDAHAWRELLANLQSIHDNESPRLWASKFKKWKADYAALYKGLNEYEKRKNRRYRAARRKMLGSH